MSEIVEKLRRNADEAAEYEIDPRILHAGADLIEQQAREIARLRRALNNIRAISTRSQDVSGPSGALADIEGLSLAALEKSNVK